MYTRRIAYTDYLGNKREEDFNFYLTKSEVIKWVSGTGDYTLDAVIEKLIKSNNRKEIFAIFEDLIYQAYGEISVDGRRFEKSEEIKKNFMETEAFSILFTEIVGDTSKAIEFMTKIMPPDLIKEIEKIEDLNKIKAAGSNA